MHIFNLFFSVSFTTLAKDIFNFRFLVKSKITSRTPSSAITLNNFLIFLDKIFPKYSNTAKTQGRGCNHPPSPPLSLFSSPCTVHGGGISLRVLFHYIRSPSLYEKGKERAMGTRLQENPKLYFVSH